MIRGMIVGVLLAVAQLGCASYGVMVSPEKVATLKKGVATEADIIAALGQPTSVTVYSGVRMLSYSGAQAQARPASFIPIIGPLVGGADSRYSMVMFRMGEDGTIADIISTYSGSGSGTGFAAGAPIAQSPDMPRKVE